MFMPKQVVSQMLGISEEVLSFLVKLGFIKQSKCKRDLICYEDAKTLANDEVLISAVNDVLTKKKHWRKYETHRLSLNLMWAISKRRGFLTVNEVAKILGVTRQRAHKIALHQCTTKRFGRKIFVVPDERWEEVLRKRGLIDT